ncbi:hypothetical protein [Streptomyces cavernicola]|uniref:Uncharacterized protein n=1 Tax=Streptomyces cavernicola TaxID=3043613 RepID=A0ABT6S2R5_9ACTN|nr:hypothetical protein [Streptomyces sp. B-S-A6]MDI3402377.1 hypothetical protein [Streptomyces sp. B-S-A6]
MNTVVYLLAASGGYSVQARDADSGKVRWTGKAWNPPPPMEGSQGDANLGEPAEIPEVSTVRQGGEEYVVVSAHGMEGKDDLHEGKEVVRLAVFPTDTSGTGVAPLREISVPVDAKMGSLRVTGTDGGLLVKWTALFNEHHSASVNVTTGKVRQHGNADALLPQCEAMVECNGSQVATMTETGPLVSLGGGGFGMPDRWLSKDVTPPGVSKEQGVLGSWNGTVVAVSGDHVLASWTTGKYGDGTPVWSIHDIRTGRVKASMSCSTETKAGKADDPGSLIVSPGGRFLASGSVAFDTTTRKGTCLAGDGDRKAMAVASITKNGTAYGVVTEGTDDDDSVVVEVPLSGGRPRSIGAGVDIPMQPLDRAGLFMTRNSTGQVVVSVRAKS